MRNNNIIYEPLPGGHAYLTAGGTRTAVKLSRPWQESLETLVAEPCPFCTKLQEEIPLDNIPSGWKLLPNTYTPHLRHRLVVPKIHWSAAQLQVLGGNCMQDALEVARLATKGDHEEMSAFTFVGRSAGQNVSHHHWHIMQVRVREPLHEATLVQYAVEDYRERIIFSSNDFIVVAGGTRPGECFFVRHKRSVAAPSWAITDAFSEDITDVFSDLVPVAQRLIALGNEKFKSTQGMPPHFAFTVRITSHWTFRYAVYTPFLAFWGTPETVMAPLEQGPFTLPWPHETTAAYLRE